jgi:hypothetical protein
MARPLPSEPPPINLGCYVQVVDTSDEFEDLIGVVEGFLNAEGEPTKKLAEAKEVTVYIPLSREGQKRRHLEGVNEFTAYAKHVLRENDGRRNFKLANLEWFDEDEL